MHTCVHLSRPFWLKRVMQSTRYDDGLVKSQPDLNGDGVALIRSKTAGR